MTPKSVKTCQNISKQGTKKEPPNAELPTLDGSFIRKYLLQLAIW
jgi:hypothetical protein